MNKIDIEEKMLTNVRLEIKKVTMKSWAAELLNRNKIDEKRYFTMVSMIDKIKE